MIGRLITYHSSNPYLNIAIEHAILKQNAGSTNPPILRVWQNPSSVIIGRIQDIKQEVDLQYCEENDIAVIRRISGGGTVYHDKGNLNVSFYFPRKIIPENKDIVQMTEFFTEFLIRVLQRMGYENLQKEGFSNIFFNKKKISGSAAYYRKKWFLHHATILFDANLEILNKTILARESYPENKKRSRYFPTINLPNFDISTFIAECKSILHSEMNVILEQSDIESDELALARTLEQELYRSQKWTLKAKRKLI